MFDFIAQVAEPVITGLDVVKTVDAFYHNAWLKLMGMLFLFGIMVVVVMPFIIQRIQSSSFAKTEKRLKDEIEQIKNKTQESIQGEVEAIKSEFDEIQKDLKKQIDKEIRLNRAEFYSQMATSFSMDFGQKFSMFFFRITAAQEYAALKDYEALTEELNRTISQKEKLSILPGKEKGETEKLVEKIRTVFLEQVDKLRKILEEQGVKDRYSELLAKVYDFCKNSVIIAEKPEPSEEPERA